MARYGMSIERRLARAVPVPDMRRIAKECGKDHRLPLDLWKTRIPEARIVAAMIEEPDRLTEDQMESWVNDIDSWDVCDQVCMNFSRRLPLPGRKSSNGPRAKRNS